MGSEKSFTTKSVIRPVVWAPTENGTDQKCPASLALL